MAAPVIALSTTDDTSIPPSAVVSAVGVVGEGASARYSPAIALLHAAACERDVVALARASMAIEETLRVPAARAVLAIESRPSLPPVDIVAGLRVLLGARASEVPAVVEVVDGSHERAAREALVAIGRVFPIIAGDESAKLRVGAFGTYVEAVIGSKIAAVGGMVVPVPAGAPPSGMRVRVSLGARMTIENAPEDVVGWLDALAGPDAGRIAARSVALGLMVLRRVLAHIPLPIKECRRIASALVDVDPNVRNALAADPKRLGDDLASRVIGAALRALSIADQASDRPSALRTIATAAMMQPLLDCFRPLALVETQLGEAALEDPTLAPEIVVAHDVVRMRRGALGSEPSTHARLALLACDETRASLVEVIELADEDVEELRASLDGQPRPTLVVPNDKHAASRTTLQRTPIHCLVAVAHRRRLSGTLLATDPEGHRHAIVFDAGAPIRARTRVAAAGDTEIAVHLARIASIAALPLSTRVEFFAGCDLLDGLDESGPISCTPQSAVLAAARALGVREHLRQAAFDLGGANRFRLSRSRLAAYRATSEELAAAHRLLVDGESLDALGAALDRVVPLLAAAHLLGELRVE